MTGPTGGGGGWVTGQPARGSGKDLVAVAQHIQQQRLEPCSQVRWSLVCLSMHAFSGGEAMGDR